MSQHDFKQVMAFAASSRCPCVARSKRFPRKNDLTGLMGKACVDSNGVLVPLPDLDRSHSPRWQERAICPCVARSRGMRRKDEVGLALWMTATQRVADDCINEPECPPPPPPVMNWVVSSDAMLYVVRTGCACEAQVSALSLVAA